MRGLCLEPRCAAPPVNGPRCVVHAREQSRQRESQIRRKGQRIYRTKRWQALRKAVLFDQPLCPCGAIATDVDHIQPLSQGGATWSRANLQGLCASCHGKKRQWETQREVELERLVVLAGKRGVGKSTVRRILVERLGMTPLGPDDHCHRWDWVIRQVDCNRRPLVECCKVPRALRARMDTRATLVELTASPDEQRRRLIRRGELDEADRWVAEDGPLGYESRITPDFSVDSTDLTPEETAEQIIAAIGEGR